MTGGNAFFVQRFLLHLHQAGLLRWDPEQRHWAWDAAAIERAELTDDVLGLMLEAIRRLPAPPSGCWRWPPASGGGWIWRCWRRWRASRIDQVAGQLVGAIQEGLLVPDADAGATDGTGSAAGDPLPLRSRSRAAGGVSAAGCSPADPAAPGLGRLLLAPVACG